MDTLYTFLDNITHYRTESVHFLGLMNSATKKLRSGHFTCLEHPELAMAEVNDFLTFEAKERNSEARLGLRSAGHETELSEQRQLLEHSQC